MREGVRARESESAREKDRERARERKRKRERERAIEREREREREREPESESASERRREAHLRSKVREALLRLFEREVRELDPLRRTHVEAYSMKIVVRRVGHPAPPTVDQVPQIIS